MKVESGKCETCINFISHITVIDDVFETWGYGCMLGGSWLNKETFFNGCDDFKGKSTKRVRTHTKK